MVPGTTVVPGLTAAAAGLPQLLIWAVLAVLLLESWLFHRKAVY